MVVVMMEELSYWGWIEELDPIEWAVEYPYSEHQNQHGQPWKWRTGDLVPGGQGFCKKPKTPGDARSGRRGDIRGK